MTERQQALFMKAERALQTARSNLQQGDTDAAANRAYYATFYAATAALLSVGETLRTHRGVHHRFYVHYVENGPLSVEVGSILAFAREVRRRADYEAFSTLDTAAVSDLVADAERFVRAVRALVEE